MTPSRPRVKLGTYLQVIISSGTLNKGVNSCLPIDNDAGRPIVVGSGEVGSSIAHHTRTVVGHDESLSGCLGSEEGFDSQLCLS